MTANKKTNIELKEKILDVMEKNLEVRMKSIDRVFAKKETFFKNLSTKIKTFFK